MKVIMVETSDGWQYVYGTRKKLYPRICVELIYGEQIDKALIAVFLHGVKELFPHARFELKEIEEC